MRFVKNVVICFLIVFFVNYLLPGIDVVNQTKIPHIRGDIIFSVSLGLLNALVIPLLSLFDGYLTKPRVAIATLILNFAAYAFLKLLPLGVFVTTAQGYITSALVTSVACFILHYMEMKHRSSKMGPSQFS